VGCPGPLGYASPAVRTVRRALVAALLAALAVLVTACQGATPYAVIVNGTAISQSQVLRELNAIADNKAFVSEYEQSAAQAASSGQSTGQPSSIFGTGIGRTYSQAFTDIILNTDLQAELVHAEVIRRRLEPPAGDIGTQANIAAAAAQFGSEPTSALSLFKLFNPWFQHVYEVRAAEELALTNALGPVDTSTAAVQRFYATNPTDFIKTECVSHILVGSEEKAASIRAKIVAGASFAAMAKKYSTDTASAAKGGSLGCAAPGSYVAPFEAVADSIRVGQLSQPVLSQFGWHLILVTSRTVQPLDGPTTAQIVQYLQQQSPIGLFIAAEQRTLAVRVNPAYGTWSPTSGVVPPTAPAANSGVPTTTLAPTASAQPPSSTP
jgi:parvulin-like peptidyl-prolyl isomerase